MKRWVVWASDHGDFCACPTKEEAEKWKARLEKEDSICHIVERDMSLDDLKRFDADNYGS